MPEVGVLLSAYMIVVSELNVGVFIVLHRVFWYERFRGAHCTLKMRAVFSVETLVRIRNTA